MLKQKYKDILLSNRLVKKLIIFTKQNSFPGFQGAPMFEVGKHLYDGIKNGTFTTRASSLAFNFFFAIFPGIIFLFTLIPLIPVDGFQQTLIELIKNYLPKGINEIAISTIEDLISTPRGGLLSFNFLLMLYLTTNGVHSLMNEFNNSYHVSETRDPFKQRLVSFILAMIITSLLVCSVGLIIATHILVDLAEKARDLQDSYSSFLIHAGKWVVVFALYYFAIALLYYYGPAKRKFFKFFSPGSFVTTILLLATLYGFSLYIQYFSTYNKIYGSIGTIMLVMLWFYLNSYILLLGFDINASIATAKKKQVLI
ncbi:MAG: YihY/virulence factor BrkB family protein [Bacteroidetes bacterium]|nr:YihY/virulence factor BrkB family protein [Bacteroidota bacterium]